MPPRRVLRGAAKNKAGKKPAAQKNQKDRRDQDDDSDDSSRSDSGTGSCSRTDEDSGSDSGSDEDDPRDYKHGGYHPVVPYQLYTGKYRVLSKLGAGAFSTVWLVADEKDLQADGPELVAMKVCKSKKSVTEQAEDEVELLERLQDSRQAGERGYAHVCQMRGHFWHSGPNGRHKCMAFEVMGENLLALVKHYDYNGLPMSWVQRLSRHTLLGLEYIHSRGVIHTDLKLENVLVQRHDLSELITESRQAFKAYMETRAGLEGLSKNQKKKLKKKEKAKNAKAAAGGPAADEDEGIPLKEAVAVAGCEEAGEADPDEAAAKACGRPIPPVRQRERFETLHLEQVFAKLADFGNGCRSTRKVTDDIQTRQYRSPEVLIGADWNETADTWSAACMFFELLTGDFLFDPHTDDNWCRDEDHLALMIELLGDHPPKEYALSGKYSREFFSNAGKLKHIKNLKFWKLASVLEEKYNVTPEDAKEIDSFLAPMLAWKPTERWHATKALQHSWVQLRPGEVDLDRPLHEASAASSGKGKGSGSATQVAAVIADATAEAGAEDDTVAAAPAEAAAAPAEAAAPAAAPATEEEDAEAAPAPGSCPAEAEEVAPAAAAAAAAVAPAPEAAAVAAAPAAAPVEPSQAAPEAPKEATGEEEEAGEEEAEGEDNDAGAAGQAAAKKKKNKKKNKGKK